MAHDVFISYSHKDKAIADAICAKLEQDGSRCWYAPRDIRAGADWAASIIDAIESSKVMVLVFTDSSNASQQVLREINNAVSAGVVLVPFKLTAKPPNRGMQYYLSTVHWLDAMDGPREKRISDLSELVRTILGQEGTGSTVSTGPARELGKPVETARKSRAPLAAVITIAALILAAAILWFTGVIRNGPQPPAEESTGIIPAEATDKISTETPTEQPTDVPTEELTEAPTEVPTEAPTEVPTNTPTSSPAPTEIPTPTATDTPEPTPTPTPTREPTYSTTENDYLYSKGAGGIILEKYMGSADVAIIPETIEGLPVRQIKDECFDGHTELIKVVLPDSMRTLEYKAFHGCTNLREMNFPDGLYEIGGWALAHTALSEVRLPDSVKKLGYGCLYGCNKLTDVVLSPGIRTIATDTFHNCARLKTVTIPAEDIDINVDAFNSNAKITLIGIPGSYTEKYARAKGLGFEAYVSENEDGEQ